MSELQFSGGLLLALASGVASDVADGLALVVPGQLVQIEEPSLLDHLRPALASSGIRVIEPPRMRLDQGRHPSEPNGWPACA